MRRIPVLVQVGAGTETKDLSPANGTWRLVTTPVTSIECETSVYSDFTRPGPAGRWLRRLLLHPTPGRDRSRHQDHQGDGELDEAKGQLQVQRTRRRERLSVRAETEEIPQEALLQALHLAEDLSEPRGRPLHVRSQGLGRRRTGRQPGEEEHHRHSAD